MKLRLRMFVMALAALAVAPSAKAQFMPGTSPMDMSAQSRALTSSAINRNALRATARDGAGRRATPPSRLAPDRSSAALSDARFPFQVSDARFPFQASPALREQVLNDFVQRASRSDPTAAKAVAAEARSPAFQQSFANAVKPYGFSPNDAADVMAVYLVTGWEIVHGTDANLTALRAVRRQVAGDMARNAALRDPTTRAKLAEELKIITTLFGGGVENAKREGATARFAADVAAHYQRTMGRDLRAMRLTSQGFSGG
jgi:hypothetical protein